MNVDFEYYKVFYYVAKLEKLSLAAEELFVSQPAVTQTIQKLEDELGTNLFVRTHNGMELTEPGKKLFDMVKDEVECLDNVEFMFQKYETLEKGTIKIRTGSNVAKFVLYEALEKFSKDYPNIQIEIATGPVDKAVEMIHKGEIDMVLTYFPYELDYHNLQAIECKKKEYIFAMSKKYAEENNVVINKVEDLNNYSLLVPKKHSAVREIFDDKFEDIITKWHFEIAQEQIRKHFVKKDCGIAFLIRDDIKRELKSGEFVEIELDGINIKGAIGAITLKDQYASYATRKLIEYIKED